MSTLLSVIEGEGARVSSGLRACEVDRDTVTGRPCPLPGVRWATLRYASGVTESKWCCEGHAKLVDATNEEPTPHLSVVAPAPSRPPETPMPAPAPPPKPTRATSPVASAKGGGVSPSRQRCRWPGCLNAGKTHGFCKTCAWRVRTGLGLILGTVDTPNGPTIAEVVRRWEERKAARPKSLLRQVAEAGTPPAAEVPVSGRDVEAAMLACDEPGVDGPTPLDVAEARIAELEAQLADARGSAERAEGRTATARARAADLEGQRASIEAELSGVRDVLDLAGVAREGTPAERVHRLVARAERAEVSLSGLRIVLTRAGTHGVKLREVLDGIALDREDHEGVTRVVERLERWRLDEAGAPEPLPTSPEPRFRITLDVADAEVGPAVRALHAVGLQAARLVPLPVGGGKT